MTWPWDDAIEEEFFASSIKEATWGTLTITLWDEKQLAELIILSSDSSEEGKILRLPLSLPQGGVNSKLMRIMLRAVLEKNWGPEVPADVLSLIKERFDGREDF